MARFVRCSLKLPLISFLITSFFLYTGCASILKGNSQEIEITSSPTGARVFVNNEQKATTPYTLILKGAERRGSYTLSVKKEGYHPYEIRMDRKWRKWVFISNMLWGALPAFGWWFDYNLEPRGRKNPQTKIILSFALSSAVFTFIDYLTGAAFQQQPNQIDSELVKQN